MQLPWHLAEEDFFKNLPLEKKEFLECSVRRLLMKNGFIFVEDEDADSCFYLEEGSIKISRTSFWGKEPIIFVRQAGNFGLAESLGGNRENANAHGVESVLLTKIKREVSEGLLSRNYPPSRRVVESSNARQYLPRGRNSWSVTWAPAAKLLICLSYSRLIEWNPATNRSGPRKPHQEKSAAARVLPANVSETLKMLQAEAISV